MGSRTLLRPFWQLVFRRAWVLMLVLFVSLGTLRAYGLLGPSSAHSLLGLNFVFMWFLPLIFLTRPGRQAIGLKRVERPIWIVWGLLIGIVASLLVFLVGFALYGHDPDNWYVSVLNSYAIDATAEQAPRAVLFVIYTIPAILLSPIGEEFFFRGMVHQSVQELWGLKASTAVTALAFGGIHLLHHGLTWSPSGVKVLFVSGLLWVGWMAVLSWVHTELRQRSGSIWPAVAAHAGFNFAMNVTIFWVLM